MKKVLLTLLVVVVILAGLSAAGFAGYRYGYAQGLQTAAGGDAQANPRGFGFGPNQMPMHGYGFDRDLGPGRGFEHGFGMMPGTRMGLGFLGPIGFVARIAFWVLVIWAVYMLVTRSGWRLTRTAAPVESQSAPDDTDVKG